MPGFVAIPDTFKVELIAHHADTLLPIVNVLHARAPSSPTASQTALLAQAVENTVHANLSAWGGGWVWDQCRVTDLNSATGPQASSAAHAGDVGGMGASGSVGVAGLVKLITDTRGRRYRGRVYMAPIAAGQVSQDGVVGSGALGNYAAFFGALQTALAALTPASTLVIASKGFYKNRKTGAITTWTPFSTDVTVILPETTVAFQRRRGGR